MKDSQHASQARRKSAIEGPAIQVICLGSGGGPSEDNVTGLLVRSTSSKWGKGSLLAVDGGCHLAAITKILKEHFPLVVSNKEAASNVNHVSSTATASDRDMDENGTKDRSTSPEETTRVLKSGPFAGLEFPFLSARANSVHVVRDHVSSYLITHPHLDHLSGFVINTAAFHNTSRPKRLIALPFTVNSIKKHIFNDVLWPNLTDEDNGVGFVTFQRLTEGGNLALGDGESRGFIEVCNGLSVKAFKVSHGTCASGIPASSIPDPARRNSLPSAHDGMWHPHAHAQNNTKSADVVTVRRASIFSPASQPATPTVFAQAGGQAVSPERTSCIVDSTAFFIRAEPSGREVLVFGDVEPDSISLVPRNHIVWTEAALKIAQGVLSGVFIECSYTDNQGDAVLFGHLAPRHLIAELCVLAELVVEKRRELLGVGPERDRKRKRVSLTGSAPDETTFATTGNSGHVKRRSNRSHTVHTGSPLAHGGEENVEDTARQGRLLSVDGHNNQGILHNRHLTQQPHTPGSTRSDSVSSVLGHLNVHDENSAPLKGLRVVVIHVKDDMADGPLVGDVIHAELLAHEARLAAQGKALGCEFQVSQAGESYWF